MANGLVFRRETLTAGLARFTLRHEAALRAAMDFMSPRVENFMKENAPWTDRTSNARNSLTARAFSSARKVGIVVAHGVPYGIWLEVRFGGIYGIIPKTLEVQGREVMHVLRSLWRKL